MRDHRAPALRHAVRLGSHHAVTLSRPTWASTLVMKRIPWPPNPQSTRLIVFMPPPQLRLWGRSEYRRRRKHRVGHDARATEFLIVINGGALKAIYAEVAFRALFSDANLLLFRNRLGR